MNKQGLVTMLMMEKISAEVKQRGKNYAKGYGKGIDLAIKLIEAGEDEPQKPVIPQFVADFIAEQKKHGLTLSYSIDASMSDGVAEWYWNNPELFARAWLDGYEVEKEAKYAVKVKGKLGQYLGRYYLNNEELTPQFIRTQKNDPSYFTKAELVNTGFGWVFDCEGIEIEEVEG